MLLARVSGGSGTPALTANGAASAFEQVDQVSYHYPACNQRRNYRGRAKRPHSGFLADHRRARHRPDHRPADAARSRRARCPAGGVRGARRLWRGYVAGTVRLGGDVAEPGIDRTPSSFSFLPGVRPRPRAASVDLTLHPWAGLPVTLRLSATGRRWPDRHHRRRDAGPAGTRVPQPHRSRHH